MLQHVEYTTEMPQRVEYFGNMQPAVIVYPAEGDMKTGDVVTVLDVHDTKLLREVVAVGEGYIYVSRPEEVERARSEGREPSCIGFRLSDVIANKIHK